jgi:hypothetical protein
MSSPLYRSIALACGATLLAMLPVGATAQPAAPLPSTDLRVEDVQTALSQVGLVVAGPVGASDGFAQVVEAHSPTSPEIVRAFVFADSATAAEGRRQAEARGDGIQYSDDAGPQLLSGYGASTWRRNVALIQTSPDTFDLLMPREIDCVTGSSGATTVPFSAYAVDPAVVQAIASFH